VKEDPQPISHSDLMRVWRIVSWAGLLGSLYGLLCILGAPRVKWLTEVGATAFDFGLIAAAGALALAFQIVGAHLTNRIRHRKLPWMIITILHRVLYIAIVVAPLLFTDVRLRMWWIVAFVFIHDALAQCSTPLWFSWMADLLPRDSMNLFWARRQRFITSLTTVGMVAMALSFEWFERRGQVSLGYTLLATIGILLGTVDILMFRWVPEPPHEPLREREFLRHLLEPMRDRGFRRFVVLMAYWNFAIFIAAPFFNPFMIEDLKMSALTVQLLAVASSVGMVLGSNYWGLLCDTYGFRPALQVLTVGKVFAPLYFLVLPGDSKLLLPFLAVFMVIDGFMNAGTTLAPQGVLLKATPRRNRTMYIAVVNFLSVGLGATIASLLAGKLIDWLNAWAIVETHGYRLRGYHWAFLVSMILRAGAIPLANRFEEDRHTSLRNFLRVMFSWRSAAATLLVGVLHGAQKEARRVWAATHLANLRSPLAIIPLIMALQDKSLTVRRAAADALGSIGTDAAAEALAQALFDPSSRIHTRAALALGHIGSPESLRALLQALRTSDRRVLRATIASLGRLRDTAALVPLICLYHDLDDEVLKERVAHALKRIASLESLQEVYSALGNPGIEKR
jgi:MFS family permease